MLLAVTLTVGCSGSSSSNPGTGGTTGSAGTGGSTGSGGTGGGGIPFEAMIPCSTESLYVSSGNTIAFGGTDPGFNYAPKCLKVSKGTTVTFNGDFAAHPLQPSASRGTTGSANPITLTNTGTTKSFTFPNSGFFAYLCMFHGAEDQEFMNGVIWVN